MGGDEPVTVMTDFDGQVRRRSPKATEWTNAKREMFLAELAESGDVTRAAAATGMHVRSVHRLRERDDQFAEQWVAAIRANYEQLEARLLRKARGEEVAGMDDVATDLALRLMVIHQNTLNGRKHGGGRRPRTASRAELIEALQDKLAKVRRRRGAPGQGSGAR